MNTNELKEDNDWNCISDDAENGSENSNDNEIIFLKMYIRKKNIQYQSLSIQ